MGGCCGIRRVGTLEVLTDSADFSGTETSLMSTFFPLVGGRVYFVEARLSLSGDTIGNLVTARLRAGGLTGTQISEDYKIIERTSTFRAVVAVLTALFSPAVTVSQQFTVSGQVEVGVGNARREGAATRPNLLWIDRIG